MSLESIFWTLVSFILHVRRSYASVLITIRRLQTCALHLLANYKVSSQTGIKGRKKFTKVKNIYLSQNLCIVGYENMNICYNNMRGLSYP